MDARRSVPFPRTPWLHRGRSPNYRSDGLPPHSDRPRRRDIAHFSSLYNDLRSQGHAIGKAAVHDLLGHLIDAFLLAAAPVATESERCRNTNPRKLYPVDPGLIQAFDSGGRSNAGHALKLVVFNELRRRGADVAYVKTKGDLEVDFLARYPSGREELIQVCVDPSEPATLGRELAALDAAGIEHPRAVRHLIVMEASTAGRIRHPHTEPVTALQWLLSSSP